ncbi:MAG TPA: response regulator transcription factor [Cytophagaceae bacterium]|jgi:DNA-binding LytR/AlgR family response regulator|nr:response regulator transcription factor [Cytophagaceae bacterium]
MKIKCLAIDDEPLALGLVSDYISQIPFLELVGSYTSALDALQVMQTEKIDLIFLDIRMPDLSGFQFLNTLVEQPLVILTTAYNQYGPESYEFEITDYLLKPISFEKFLKAANKAKEVFEEKSKRQSDRIISDDKDYIFVNSEYKLIKIKIKDIQFIEGLKDYIKIHVEGFERPVLTIMRIKTFEEKLPHMDFVRVHRSFLLNIHKIESIQRSVVTIGKHEIPVGLSYADPFFKLVEDKNWK